MTGGGFGGSVIALLPAERVAEASEAVAEAFQAAGYGSPVCRIVAPAQGARRD
jgi:galactokinase